MAKKTKPDDNEFEGMTPTQVKAHFNKMFGPNSVVTASDAVGAVITHISTGIYDLDFALGGGYAKNRVIELRGPFSSFKSTLCLVAARNFLESHPDAVVFYVDVEKSFDPIYAARLGIDLNRLYIVNPDSGEQAVDIVKEAMKWNVPRLFIIDSIAALVPSAEVDASAGQQTMALQARLIAKMMRILTASMKRHLYTENVATTTVLAINQLRSKVGVIFGSPETTPGGLAKDFAYSQIVRLHASLSKTAAIEEDVIQQGVKFKIRFGQEVDFKIIKNKCGGAQGESGSFTYYERDYKEHKANSFDNVGALFKYGAFLKVIKYGNQIYSFRKVSAKNESQFKKALRGKPITQAKLYAAILKKLDDLKMGSINLEGSSEEEED